nr:hypothetical protein Iba_chr12eCG2590 [Ipomoea batatas]
MQEDWKQAISTHIGTGARKAKNNTPGLFPTSFAAKKCPPLFSNNPLTFLHTWTTSELANITPHTANPLHRLVACAVNIWHSAHPHNKSVRRRPRPSLLNPSALSLPTASPLVTASHPTTIWANQHSLTHVTPIKLDLQAGSHQLSIEDAEPYSHKIQSLVEKWPQNGRNNKNRMKRKGGKRKERFLDKTPSLESCASPSSTPVKD